MAASQERVWHILIDDKPCGPYSAEEIRQWLAEERLVPEDHCWTAGMAEWAPVGEVTELVHAGGKRSSWPVIAIAAVVAAAGGALCLFLIGSGSRASTESRSFQTDTGLESSQSSDLGFGHGIAARVFSFIPSAWKSRANQWIPGKREPRADEVFPAPPEPEEISPNAESELDRPATQATKTYPGGTPQDLNARPEEGGSGKPKPEAEASPEEERLARLDQDLETRLYQAYQAFEEGRYFEARRLCNSVVTDGSREPSAARFLASARDMLHWLDLAENPDQRFAIWGNMRTGDGMLLEVRDRLYDQSNYVKVGSYMDGYLVESVSSNLRSATITGRGKRVTILYERH